jgi:ABC-2 type transport system ATP-binding protein
VNTIEVKNLVKKYKKADKPSVDDISFSVKEGSFFALLGPNGAGKTTTVSILTTILAKTSGDVKIAGFDIDKESNKVREKIGVIFQNPSLDMNLTAEENVRFHTNLYKLYTYRPSYNLMSDKYKKRVNELAKVLGIKDDMFKPTKNLSGGMKRKLEIIRGLMHNPKVLFLDEPTTGLDPVSRKSLWEYLKSIREKENITIFLTTHYLDEAEGADFIAIMNNGKIVEQGTPAHIKSKLIQKYIILDAEDRLRLTDELTENKYDFDGHGPFRIHLNGHNAQDIIKSIDTKLSFLDIYNPSLEEAYVQIIKETSPNND